MAYQGTVPASAGSLSQLLTKDYAKVFFDEYKRYNPYYTMLAKVISHDMHSLKEGSMMGFGKLTPYEDGSPPDADVIVQGPEKEVTFTDYGKMWMVTRNMAADDITGHLKKVPRKFSEVANYTVETLWWDILNSGFVTTVRTGIDGAALFSNSHTRIDGGTADNLGSGALSETTLEAGIQHFRDMKNEHGQPIQMSPKVLVIPTALEWTAKRLLLSELRPGTANNDINALKDEGLQYIVCPYLTSSTAWFLLSDEHDLRHIWRRNIGFSSWDDEATKSALFSVDFRVADEFWDWRGAYASPGT